MASPARYPHPVRRIELTPSYLRVYLDFSRKQQESTFYIITFSDLDLERNVYKGTLPPKNGTFKLFDTVKEIAIAEAEFEGNAHAGEIKVAIDALGPFSKLFVRFEQTPGICDESEWVSLPGTSEELSLRGTVALIPCYNIQKYCRKVVERTQRFAEHVLCIDDGSTDETSQILKELCRDFPGKIDLITFEKNRGKGHALIEGFRYALDHYDFEALITIDGDAQHRPSDIPYIANEVKKGVDFVVGERIFKLMPFRSRFANRVIAFILRLIYPKAPLDTQSGMRGFSREMLREIVEYVPGGRYETEFKCLLFALHTHKKMKSLPICTIYLEKNVSSHFSVIRDSLKILSVFLSFPFFILFHHGFKKKHPLP